MNDDITGSTRARNGFQFSNNARLYRSDRSWCAANSTELMWKYSGFSVAPSSGSYTPQCSRSRTTAGSRSDGSRSAIWRVSISRTSQTVAVSVFIWCWQRELALGKELFHCVEMSELKTTAGMWLGLSACPHGCWSDAASLLTRWGGLCNNHHIKSINQLLGHIAVLRTQMRPTVTNVAWSVGLSVTIVSPAKTAEPIEMPYGLWTRLDPRTMYWMGIQIPQCKGTILKQKTRPIMVKYMESLP